jgi:hypothetical protein
LITARPHALTAHVVVEAVGRGWETLENGTLLDAACRIALVPALSAKRDSEQVLQKSS